MKIINQGKNLWKGRKHRYSYHELFTLIFSILFLNSSFGQEVHVSAKLDSTSMRIGEQVHLNLSIIAPSRASITFPIVPDTLHKIEIIQRSKIDTIKAEDGKTITYKQQYTLTAFDSGYYVVEPFTFHYKRDGSTFNDSISTEAMLLQVITVPVDTTREIKDIKPPVEVPFTIREALPYIIGGVLLIALVFIILKIIKNRKKITPDFKPKIPSRPPHEIALEALKKAEAEKLWQQGFYKQYHSTVADTVRTYIEQRFSSVRAMELTTDEILEQFKGNLITEEAKEKLKYFLHMADMVKFAKAIPVGTENEQVMGYAVQFIMLTKPVTKDDFNIPKKETVQEKEVPL